MRYFGHKLLVGAFPEYLLRHFEASVNAREYSPLDNEQRRTRLEFRRVNFHTTREMLRLDGKKLLANGGFVIQR
jgi:hypothetical protein